MLLCQVFSPVDKEYNALTIFVRVIVEGEINTDALNLGTKKVMQ
jgi:hypothetical protein